MTTSFSVSTAVALFLACAPLLAEGAPPVQGLVLTDVRVLDLDDGSAGQPRRVVVKDGVVHLGDDVQVAEDAIRIDGRGKFLLPGLVDSHVHYCDPSFGPLLLAHGVTLVRDLGNQPESIRATRERIDAGEEVGPEILAVGPILDGSPPVWPFSIEISTPAEARAAVRAVVEGGFDQVKVYSRLQADALAAIVDEASKHDLRIVGHVPTAMSLEQVIDAGVDETQHLYGLAMLIATSTGREEIARERHLSEAWPFWSEVPPATLERVLAKIVDAGLAMTPTMVVFESMAQSPDDFAAGPWAKAVPESMLGWWSRVTDERRATEAASMDARRAAVGRLHAAGVPLLAGSDLCNPRVVAGASLHRELELFVESGLSPLEALRTATLVPAKQLDRPDLGVIADGGPASFVLLGADPMEDLAALETIEAVVVRGRLYRLEDLDAMIPGVVLLGYAEPEVATEP